MTNQEELLLCLATTTAVLTAITARLNQMAIVPVINKDERQALIDAMDVIGRTTKAIKEGEA